MMAKNKSKIVKKEVKAIKKALKPKKNRGGNKQVTTAAVQGIKGRGAYETSSPGLVNQLASSVGSALASSINPALGGLGGAAGSFLSKLVGFGEYKVKSNALMKAADQSAKVGRPPSFLRGKDCSFSFAHEEYIMDITSTQDFEVLASEPINVGNQKLFPLLSQFSQMFEEAEIEGLVFEIRSTCSNANSGLGLGTINVSTEYDAYDEVPENKRSMDEQQFSTSEKPTEDQIHPIECAPDGNVLRRQYIVPGINHDNMENVEGDLRMAALGNVTFATDGQPTSGQVIAEAWSSYKVKFFRPVLESSAMTDLSFTQHINGQMVTDGSTLSVEYSVTNRPPGFAIATGSGHITISNDPTAQASGDTGTYLIVCTMLSHAGTETFTHAANQQPTFTGDCAPLNVLAQYGVQKATSYAAAGQSTAVAAYFSANGTSFVSTCIVSWSGVGTVSIPAAYTSATACDVDIVITNYSENVRAKRRGFTKMKQIVDWHGIHKRITEARRKAPLNTNSSIDCVKEGFITKSKQRSITDDGDSDTVCSPYEDLSEYQAFLAYKQKQSLSQSSKS